MALFTVVGLKWGGAGKTPFEMTLGGEGNYRTQVKFIRFRKLFQLESGDGRVVACICVCLSEVLVWLGLVGFDADFWDFLVDGGEKGREAEGREWELEGEGS
ncbi:MAG TPA: hypothetical protein VLL52_05060 [Anaerolineae bacterium]|nr:hypothetical protein [Anaerolineae bacterium]